MALLFVPLLLGPVVWGPPEPLGPGALDCRLELKGTDW